MARNNWPASPWITGWIFSPLALWPTIIDQPEAVRRHAGDILRREMTGPILSAPAAQRISVALERIIVRCLEREPDRRYAFMSVLVMSCRPHFTFDPSTDGERRSALATVGFVALVIFAKASNRLYRAL